MRCRIWALLVGLAKKAGIDLRQGYALVTCFGNTAARIHPF
ncbi:hypothetical protein [Paracoccus alcaliphilus]|nr:hypothetical protein [Paracoccus alcaliphilus]